jgi:hypothetical protein
LGTLVFADSLLSRASCSFSMKTETSFFVMFYFPYSNDHLVLYSPNNLSDAPTWDMATVL